MRFPNKNQYASVHVGCFQSTFPFMRVEDHKLQSPTAQGLMSGVHFQFPDMSPTTGLDRSKLTGRAGLPRLCASLPAAAEVRL